MGLQDVESGSTVPFQDGGKLGYRWVILFIVWLSFLLSFIDRLTWANVALKVGGSLGLPLAALGVFVTAFYIGYVLCNALGGIASDRVGGRVTLSLSILSLGVCTFLFSFTTSLWFGIVLQFFMGLAAGADYSSCVKLIVFWFVQSYRGRAMGILLVASSLGVTMTNAIVPTLAGKIGWQSVYQLFGLITISVGIIAFILLRDQPFGIIRDVPAKFDFRVILRNQNLVLLALTGFAGFWGTWGFIFWANTLMVKAREIPPVTAGFIIATVGLAAIIGKPLIGWLSDFIGGRKWLAFSSFALFAAMLLVFGSLQGQYSFRIAAPILGLGAFVYSPLLAAMVVESSGAEFAGTATGVLAAIWQLGSVIVPIVVGIIFQITGSFEAAFASLAAGPVLAGILILFVQESGTAEKI